MADDSGNDLLTTEEAAEALGLSKSTLDNWRTRDQGPRYIRLGETATSKVVYRRSELERWLTAHGRGPDHTA